MTDHLVILRPKWLLNILDGSKRVEFRAGRDRRAPHGKVTAGDRLWLKASGGNVWGVAYVETVYTGGPLHSFDLALMMLDSDVRATIDDEWAQKVMTAKYVTAVRVDRVERLTTTIDVSDIRGKRQDAWQVLDPEDANLLWTRYYHAIVADEGAAA